MDETRTLIFLCRLDCGTWAMYNARPASGTVSIKDGFMPLQEGLVPSVFPSLDDPSGLYRDPTTDMLWIVQYTRHHRTAVLRFWTYS